MAKREKSLMRQLIEERGIKDIDGVQALVKELTAGLIQEAMDAELDEELGYSKYDYKNKQTDNSRNGSYKKTVSSSQGDVYMPVQRARCLFRPREKAAAPQHSTAKAPRAHAHVKLCPVFGSTASRMVTVTLCDTPLTV